MARRDRRGRLRRGPRAHRERALLLSSPTSSHTVPPDDHRHEGKHQRPQPSPGGDRARPRTVGAPTSTSRAKPPTATSGLPSITVGADPEMTPRVETLSVPYAFISNNAIGAITRLRDMKIEPFLIASSLRAGTQQNRARPMISPALVMMFFMSPSLPASVEPLDPQLSTLDVAFTAFPQSAPHSAPPL